MQKASAIISNSNDKRIAGHICITPGTMGTIMHAIAMKFFGPDIYSWEPETVAMEFDEEFGIQSYDGNIDKLNAILSSVSSDSFYDDWVAYTQVCSTLSGENTIEELAEVTVEELAWGVMEMSLNDEDYRKTRFSADICVLTGQVLDQNGYVFPPPQLSFAKLPSRYMGSTYEADINKEKNNTTLHAALLAEYLRDQALTLYKQMKMLPWIDEQDFKLALRTASEQLNLSRQVDNIL